MDDVIKLAAQKLASITAEEWQRMCQRCQHVRNIEQQLMALEGILDASYGGHEEGQACGDGIYADIAGVVPLE
jgi:hypothetical protein